MKLYFISNIICSYYCRIVGYLIIIYIMYYNLNRRCRLSVYDGLGQSSSWESSSFSGSPSSGKKLSTALAITRSTTISLYRSLSFDKLIAFFKSISIVLRSLIMVWCQVSQGFSHEHYSTISPLSVNNHYSVVCSVLDFPQLSLDTEFIYSASQ